MRYLSVSKSLRRSTAPESARAIDSEKTPLTDNQSIDSTVHASLPPPALKVKKVDYFYSRWSKKWKYQNSGSNVVPEVMTTLPAADGKDDTWQAFCFVVVRKMPNVQVGKEAEPYFRIVVKSPYLLKACVDVVGEIPGLSWNAVPLELDPKLLLAFLPRFQQYRDELKAKTNATEEDVNIVATVDVVIDYFRKDYRATLNAIQNMTSHSEITFDLLYAIMVPRSIMITTNPVTKEHQALKLASVTKIKSGSGMLIYELILEGIDVDDAASNVKAFARTQARMVVVPFTGTIKITSLDVYPIQYHPREAEIRQTLLARGRKWVRFAHGIHHMYYNGTGGSRQQNSKVTKYDVASRVMIDRGNFRKFNNNYGYPLYKNVAPPGPTMSRPPTPEVHLHMMRSNFPESHSNIPLQVQESDKWGTVELTEEELLITSPTLYAFSLADKLWLELNVENVEAIEWDTEAFSNLVIPADRKALLQSLVEAHNGEMVFDDFIKGKGRGLVVNLFGPPGVGKTLSAEVTSEHVKRPLYVVGAGDLGTDASVLDARLQRVFELATSWKAIVLIDEADVFLEERSLHDLERNAMVAVFLRHLEYYPAILFLTTNRVKAFDEAFLSRIHVALHFHGLSVEARRSVWTAFLGKVGVKIGPQGGISEEELKKLIERDVNGRQVKNATRTANSLALSRGESLRYKHLTEVLDVMDQFSADFENMRKAH